MKTPYSISFYFICVSSLLFSASYNMLIPELPNYITTLGGYEYKGLIIALFTLTACLSRPFSGKLTDTIGRKPVLIFGALVCVLCGFLYPVFSSLSGFLFLRLVHGFSTGFTPTAIATYIADIIPENKRGEAIGIQGLFFSTGLALGPALGSLLKNQYSFNVLFYCSSIIAFLAIIFALKTKETLAERQTLSFAILKISRREILYKKVLAPSLITLLYYFPFGVILTLIPDWSDHLGVSNKGIFFIYFTISSLFVRFIAGKLSDIHGRIIVIEIGLLVLITSLLMIGYYTNSNGLLLGSIFYGFAIGILSPAVNAWTIDMSSSKHRGKAMATMYIGLEIGIGLGALFSGWYYQNLISNIPILFFGCAFISFLALAYVFYISKKHKKTN